MLGVAGFGGGFAAVFWVFVAVAKARGAGDDTAGAAEAAGVCVGDVALDAADAAIPRIVSEHGFAIIAGVAIAVGGAGGAILEATGGVRIGGLDALGVRALSGAVGGGRNRHAGGTAPPTHQKPNHAEHRQQRDAVLHPPLTRE